jgi:anti-anti-sigma factor
VHTHDGSSGLANPGSRKKVPDDSMDYFSSLQARVPMAIKIHQYAFQQNMILEITGKVASQDSLQISKKIQALAKKKFSRVIIDLSTIQYIDSQWLGIFVYTWKLLRENHKELIFLIPPGFIRNLFTASNLGRVFKVIGSLDELNVVPSAGPAESSQTNADPRSSVPDNGTVFTES